MSDAALTTALEALEARLDGGATLDVLQARFGLTTFERALVLLCAGVEMDAAVARSCCRARSGARWPRAGR